MDTDVEVYKPLDEFLDKEAFTGFEDIHYPVTATLGAEKGNPVIKLMLDYLQGPIWMSDIETGEPLTGIDIIDTDEIIMKLNGQILMVQF